MALVAFDYQGGKIYVDEVTHAIKAFYPSYNPPQSDFEGLRHRIEAMLKLVQSYGKTIHPS